MACVTQGQGTAQGHRREQAGLGMSSRGQRKSPGSLDPLKLSALNVPRGQGHHGGGRGWSGGVWATPPAPLAPGMSVSPSSPHPQAWASSAQSCGVPGRVPSEAGRVPGLGRLPPPLPLARLPQFGDSLFLLGQPSQTGKVWLMRAGKGQDWLHHEAEAEALPPSLGGFGMNPAYATS